MLAGAVIRRPAELVGPIPLGIEQGTDDFVARVVDWAA